MSTYLFAWNPNKWAWSDRQDLMKKLPYEKPIRQWKTSRTTNIGIGDDFILVKLGSNLSENEKGIIGIGKISSNLRKDKDFLKNDKIVNYVDLEFSQLTNNPLISLSKLKEIDSTINWTPQQNGSQLSTSTYTKILNLLNKDQDSILFEKKIYFPIIAETINAILIEVESVHRDRIVDVLIEKYSSTFEKIAKNSGKSIIFIAQNMMDWFSAELTKQSEIVAEWQNKYIRTKIKINGREITNFALALNSQQNERIEDNKTYLEGSVNAYERNSKARQVCLNHYGYSCQCCGFNFEKIYGEIGKNFIHVHHLKPLSEIKEKYVLDPIADLIPVCANCHAILHRTTPPLFIDDLKQKLHNDQI